MPGNKTKLMYRFDAKQQGDTRVHLIYFYDEISALGKFDYKEWKYEDSETSAKYIRDKLDEIPDGDSIEVHINSAGGEVGEGVTIYNLLRQKKNKGCRIDSFVDGFCYSVAVDIAMAGDTIHMGLGTSMLVHFPWCSATGNAEQLRNKADQLDALGEAALKLYMSRAKGISEDDFRALMKKETVLTPDDCLKYGLCDVIDDYQAEHFEADPYQKAASGAKELIIEELRQQARVNESYTTMLQLLKEKDPDPKKTGSANNIVMKTFINGLNTSVKGKGV